MASKRQLRKFKTSEICLRHNHPSKYYQATTIVENTTRSQHPSAQFSPETTNHDRIRLSNSPHSRNVDVSYVLRKDDSSRDKTLTNSWPFFAKQPAKCRCKSRGTITFTRHPFFLVHGSRPCWLCQIVDKFLEKELESLLGKCSVRGIKVTPEIEHTRVHSTHQVG